MDWRIMEDNSTAGKVWSLHCSGMAVPEIADKLGIAPNLAHDCIVEEWQRDHDEWLASIRRGK